MSKPASHHIARHMALSCTALLLLSGCGRIKSAVDSNAGFRKNAVDSARKSCVQAASAKLPNASPQMKAKLDSYCDCFATRGLNNFSNSELMEVGLSGGKMSRETQTKLNSAVQMCIGTLQQPQPADK